MAKLKYLWQAFFKDGTAITQEPNDRYSKHSWKAKYNPSSYRDFEEYYHGHEKELVSFCLVENKRGGEMVAVVQFRTYDNGHSEELARPRLYIRNGDKWDMEEPDVDIYNAEPEYYREMAVEVSTGRISRPKVMSYVLGFKGYTAPDGAGQEYILRRAVI